MILRKIRGENSGAAATDGHRFSQLVCQLMQVLFDIRNSSLAMVPLVPYTNVVLERFVDCVFEVFLHPNRWSAQVPGAPQ